MQANYFNSVLQFLQAEKKICLRSLKLGFNMSSIKDIFNESNQAKVAEIVFCTSRLLDEITDYKFKDTMQVPPSDQAIVFYTAGYIGRSIMKNVKCKDCIKMLSADCHLIASDFEGETENVNSEQEYLNLINRGGLTKPSDILFMRCIHAWTLLQKLQLEESISILNAKCLNGCSFKVYLSRISNASFNIKAKNIVSIANDNISTTKREHADHKRSGIAKKIKRTQ